MIKKVLTLMIIVAVSIALIGCSAAVDGKKLDPSGIYEGKPGEGFQGPIYKFDSTDERTKVWMGSESGFEFFDLNSQKMVMVYAHCNLRYKFECVQPHDKGN